MDSSSWILWVLLVKMGDTQPQFLRGGALRIRMFVVRMCFWWAELDGDRYGDGVRGGFRFRFRFRFLSSPLFTR